MSVAAVGAVGVAVVGGIASSNAASKQADTTKQAAAGQQMVEMQQLDMAKQQWQRYLDTYAPLENEYVNEAKDAGSIATQNKAASMAQAANVAAYSGARSKLSASGLNPQGQKYLQAAGAINLAEAASSTTSQNDAREKVISRGDARMTDALSLGKGLPAQAASTLNAASSTGYGLMRAGIDQAKEQYGADIAGLGSFGKAVGGLSNNKAFQSWLNAPSSGAAEWTGLGVNYGGISAATQSIAPVGGVAD